jgi:hypothetical protein
MPRFDFRTEDAKVDFIPEKCNRFSASSTDRNGGKIDWHPIASEQEIRAENSLFNGKMVVSDSEEQDEPHVTVIFRRNPDHCWLYTQTNCHPGRGTLNAHEQWFPSGINDFDF